MKEYLVFVDGDYQLIQTGNGWARININILTLKKSGIKDYHILEVDDDWCDWWWEDEEE